MDRETLTVWLDTALLMLGSFVLMTVLIISVINPPAKKSESEDNVIPGPVVVEIYWNDDDDTDVDLWVQGPHDRPVGYSSLSSQTFNLLRDDLGRISDPSGKNYENAYSRGRTPGEYIVNVHLYKARTPPPEDVHVIVWMRGEQNKITVFDGEVTLEYENQEITVIRFTLDDKGNVVSKNSIPYPLRVAR